jgi:hypothetical protein
MIEIELFGVIHPKRRLLITTVTSGGVNSGFVA